MKGQTKTWYNLIKTKPKELGLLYSLLLGLKLASVYSVPDDTMYKVRFGHDNTNDVSVEKYKDGNLQGSAHKAEVAELVSCEEAR